ncbi:MAG TPA: hypothetical protein VI911_09045 [Patescibacteria group bacterium]|nr:MAG: hypothetical protein UR43_C0005G0023 [candidate division TM6 bacterium GW2011_GWF2_33_332]HLD91144.1 hypothetical protein [Patescibacteria group bacterium]
MILYDVVKKELIKFKAVTDDNGNEIFVENIFEQDGTLYSNKEQAIKELTRITEEHEKNLKDTGDWYLLLNPQQLQQGYHYTYDTGNEVIEFFILEREIDIKLCSCPRPSDDNDGMIQFD